MKRIIAICEGQTEQEFCNRLLVPFFTPKGIFLNAPLIKHSHGGIVPWSQLLRQITIHLQAERTAYVTTMIDYYGITDNLQFPHWEEAKRKQHVEERVRTLEIGMLEGINEPLRPRFLPYIQMHEFEGLLFSNADVFDKVIPKEDLIGAEELRQTMLTFENPEMINNSRATSPSHRLERIICGYDKVVYGNYIAENIGLNKIRERCPRFNSWILSLLNIRDL